ncbi:MAG: hypothetical protein NWE81_00205 [Candidatus Bathyarchaeota archaeon]|nr:hypothetical protein [Candidatus Bathyarchaeota archaeon]
MVAKPERRSKLRWGTRKRLSAIIVFAILTLALQYLVTALTVSQTKKDPTAIVLPYMSSVVSPLFHLLPIAVTITLTACFSYVSDLLAVRKKAPLTKSVRTGRRSNAIRVKSKRRFLDRLRTLAQTARRRILRNQVLSYIGKRMASAENSVRSAVSILASFTLLLALVTFAAYPRLILNATLDFFGWNTAFLNFVAATYEFSNALTNAVQPIGAVAASVQRALITAAPSFRTVLEGAASITSGLAALSPAEKFLIIQNSAAWTVAILALLVGQKMRTRRRVR